MLEKQLLDRFAPLSQIEGELHLAIGVFDGIHLGHQAVIASAQQAAQTSAATQAQVVVVTFEPHPIRVIAPARAPRMLASHEHKLLILRRLGIEQVLTLHFDALFAGLEAVDFLRNLQQASAGRIASISVGHDWRFGSQAQGDLSLLREFGAKHEITIKGIERVSFRQERVSSTRIRAAIEDGNFPLASDLLGRSYTVLGEVIQGQQLGRKLGFPTANLRVFSEQLPPSGVYAVRARQIYDCVYAPDFPLQGVANLGTRPSVSNESKKRQLEVHLFDFQTEIYGEQLEVEFHDFLRPEMRFESLACLQAQIKQDKQQAKKLLL